MKNKLIVMLSLFTIMLATSACTNTVDGAGRDIEKAGENIQRSVN